MKKYQTGKWEKITDTLFGDFNQKNEGPYFGYRVLTDTSYMLGRFNKDQQEDGVIANVWGMGIEFAKYKNGIRQYPVIRVTPTGNIYIIVDENKNGLHRELYFHPLDSSFEYRMVSSTDSQEGIQIRYDGLTSELYVTEYDDGEPLKEVKVPKKFVVNNPIIYHCENKYPLEVDIEDFKFFDQGDQTYVDNAETHNDAYGVGITTVNEKLYSVGTWKNSERDGYQAIQEEDGFNIHYGRANDYIGPTVEVRDDGSIWLYAETVDEDGEKVNTATLRIRGDVLEFFDTVTNSIEIGDKSLRIKGLNEISFDEKGDNNYTDFYYADALLKASSPKKEEKQIDKNDPEYKMMALVGQEDAKKEFTRIRAYIQKNDASKIYKNIVFMGENGVGKSTVGRLISEVLYKYKAVENRLYTEVNAKELYNNFTGGTKENLDALVKQGGGGVILIDDLHYLDALNSSNVNEGLFSLAKLMEENPKTCFILCDNKYNMNQILENNLDLFQGKIRFRVNFKDFTKDELKQILNIKLDEKGYKIEEDAMDKLLEIIFLSKTYGNNINASAAISILEEVIVIQNVRTEFIDSKTITKDDIDVYVVENDIAFIDQKTGYQSDARKKLDELVGLEQIKDTVDDLIAYFSINRGKRVDFHMCFSGNPGTGKTEVARIMGKLLRQEGILPSSKFLEVTRKDLIGQYIGQTAILTRDIIDKAMGGVLYIDEAYSLAYGTDKEGGGRDFGPECIAELLKAMEDRRGEFCVILAGYTSEMKKLFDLNPGFKSRIKFDLEFPDYSEEELEKIARIFLKRDNNTMSDENLKFLVKIVSLQRKKPNFANVRTLREAISRTQIKHARLVRLHPEYDPNELTREDIEAAFSKEEIDAVNEEIREQEKEEVKVPKLNPELLRNLYQESKPAPFAETRNYIDEAVLALRMSEGKSGEGTGFIVSKDGYFLTCAHCVEGANKIEARRRINHHGRHIDINYNVIVVSVDKQADVALCQLDAPNEEFDYLRLSKSDNQLDKLSRVYLLGYPFGVSRFDEMSINEGKITSYQKATDKMLGQINLDIQAKGGNSGSPLIDAETSEVIGVFCGSALSRGSEIVEEINYARPIEYVWNMLDREYKENN